MRAAAVRARDAVERAWLALGGPATVGIAARTRRGAGVSSTNSRRSSDAPRGHVDLAKLATALEALYAPSRPDKSIRVQLLTVHKAKGLSSTRSSCRASSGARATTTSACCSGRACRPRAAADSSSRRWRARATNRTACIAGSRSWSPRSSRRKSGVCSTSPRPAQSAGCTSSAAARSRTATAVRRPSCSPRRPWPSACCGRCSSADFQARLAEVGCDRGRGRRPTSGARPAAAPTAARIGGRRRSSRLASSRPAGRRPATQPAVEFDWATETARHVGTVVHRELLRLAREGTGAGVPEGDDAATLPRRTRRTRRACGAACGGRRSRRGGGAAHARGRPRTVAPRCRQHASAESELALDRACRRRSRVGRDRPDLRGRAGDPLDRGLQDEQPRGRGARGFPRRASRSATGRNSSDTRRWCGTWARSPCVSGSTSRCCRPGGPGPRASRSRRTAAVPRHRPDRGTRARERGRAARPARGATVPSSWKLRPGARRECGVHRRAGRPCRSRAR